MSVFLPGIEISGCDRLGTILRLGCACKICAGTAVKITGTVEEAVADRGALVPGTIPPNSRLPKKQIQQKATSAVNIVKRRKGSAPSNPVMDESICGPVGGEN
jgi:hypothetical protein